MVSRASLRPFWLARSNSRPGRAAAEAARGQAPRLLRAALREAEPAGACRVAANTRPARSSTCPRSPMWRASTPSCGGTAEGAQGRRRAPARSLRRGPRAVSLQHPRGVAGGPSSRAPATAPSHDQAPLLARYGLHVSVGELAGLAPPVVRAGRSGSARRRTPAATSSVAWARVFRSECCWRAAGFRRGSRARCWSWRGRV
jgi:hypothetical protein